jgi:peptidoglycan/LPS O-acetylase OafA/YrhL
MGNAPKAFVAVLLAAGAFALVQWLFGATEQRQWQISIVFGSVIFAGGFLHMAGLFNPRARQQIPAWVRSLLAIAGITVPLFFALYVVAGLQLFWLFAVGFVSLFIAGAAIAVSHSRNEPL